MSRTYRNTKYANALARNLRHINYRRNEAKAYDEILETYGRAYASNRLASANSRIVDNWDDYYVSGINENPPAYTLYDAETLLYIQPNLALTDAIDKALKFANKQQADAFISANNLEAIRIRRYI